MKNKFNSKTYQGKDRIYASIKNATRISRLLVWDIVKKEYLVPHSGKTFLARRYENNKRVSKFFDTLEEARSCQEGNLLEENPYAPTKKVNNTPLFSKVVEDWMKRGLVGAEASTLRLYERTLKAHFSMMLDKHMDEITGNYIDEWLDEIMNKDGPRFQDNKRTSFRGEINLLRSILLFYKDSARKNYGHTTWVYPLEKNQIKRAKRKIRQSKRDRDIKLTQEQFAVFRKELGEKGKYKDIMPDYATIQFYCSLRVSECAALFHEDIHLDFKNPHLSYMVVSRHIDWPRKKGVSSQLLEGFKNSKHLKNHTKRLAIFPEAFEVLKRIWCPNKKGLLFRNGTRFFEYREIENSYNRAFERAKLPYSATHIMRHAGTTWLFNESQGDASLAQQQLGVKEMDTVFTYVARDKDALSKFAKKMWEKDESKE